jgi:uncharacterized protein (DUF433 family)
MTREYIECRNDSYYVAGTRVSLESVVRQFREGASPESILQRFPALDSLANVYGAIAFFLDNAEAIDEYLTRQQKMWESLARNADVPPEGFLRKAGPLQPSR